MKLTSLRSGAVRCTRHAWFMWRMVCAVSATVATFAGAQSFAPTYDLQNLPGSGGDAAQILAYGGTASDAFGRTVRVGDVNGDGIQDMIAGATGADVGNPIRAEAGAVYIWLGQAALEGVKDVAGAAGSVPDVTIWGASPGDQVTSAGSLLVKDLNGDGMADLLMGASLADGPGNGRNNSGEGYIVFGRGSFPAVLDLAIQGPGGADVTIYGASNDDNLAASGTLAAGDFNGDGKTDLLLGAPLADGPAESRGSSGEAYLVFGRDVLPATLDLAVQGSAGADVTIHGANASDFLTLGGSLAAGDVNGDSIADILLGAQGGDGPGETRSSAGEAFVVFGRASFGLTIDLTVQGEGGADATIWGATANDSLASSGGLAVRDFDGDGIGDVILGASGGDGPLEVRSGAGEAYIIRGRSSLPFSLDIGAGGADLTIYGATASDSLTSGGAFAFGDVNGDGVQDVVLGAPLADGPAESRNSAGEAFIIFGGAITTPVRDLAIPGGADVTIYGATGGDNLCIGRTLAVADVNGNGIGDIILGAPLADGPGEARLSAGETYIVRGRASLPATLDLALPGNAGANVTLFGATGNDQLTSGGALAAGDLNGDGLADLVLGISNGDGPADGRNGAGEISVLYGIGTPQIAVAQPAAIDIPAGGGKSFGSVAAEMTKRLVFSIKNVGAVNLTITGLTIDGTDAGQFAITSSPATVLAPGGDTTFTVTFTPDGFGLREAALHITSNDEDQSPFDITLSGLGVIPIPPLVTALDAEITGSVSATLNGAVNALGSEREVLFEYGTTTGYGSTVAAEPALIDGINAVPVAVPLDGLLPRTLYHFRVRAIGPLGEAVSADRTFVTPNQIPVSLPDSIAIQPGTTAVLSVLGNDTDGDGDILQIVSFTKPSRARGGKLELTGGQLVFSASSSFTGASFSYTVADGYGGTATATVTLTPLICTLTPATASISAAGGTYPVAVAADGFWTVADLPSWVLASPLSGYGEGTVLVTVLSNKSNGVRKRTITIGGESHAITQTGARHLPNTGPMPGNLVSAFDGLIDRHASLNENLGSRLQFTTTLSGAFTAKVTTGESAQPAAGVFREDADSGLWQTAMPLAGPSQQALSLELTLDPAQSSATGELADSGVNAAAVDAWRKTQAAATFHAGYAFAVRQPNLDSSLPQGSGWGLLSVDSGGDVCLAGILPDGQCFTSSTFVGPQGQVLTYESLYSDGGSLAGAPVITTAAAVADNTLGGELTWLAPAIPGSRKTPSRPGFGPIPVSVSGEAVIVPRRR